MRTPTSGTHISRSSLTGKILFGPLWEERGDEPIKICSIPWRLVFSAVAWMLWAILAISTFAFSFFLVFLFTGNRPAVFEGDPVGELWCPIKHWPKRNGKNIRPIWPALILAFAANTIWPQRTWEVLLYCLPALKILGAMVCIGGLIFFPVIIDRLFRITVDLWCKVIDNKIYMTYSAVISEKFGRLCSTIKVGP